MKKWIDSALWEPKGIKNLEVNAEKAVKKINKNIFVSAGPGAGKTELLAQKACYLLETNKCKISQRILAISFKKDAAKNLKSRVELRVGKDLAQRFDSFTFDAFAVNILSRFRNGLPNNYRPTKNYRIDLELNKRLVMQELIRSFEGEKGLLFCELDSFNPSTFERDYLCKNKLSLEKKINDNNTGEKVSNLIWNKKICEIFPSELSFNMINRLSEFILRLNPLILSYLRQTYAYVFLDEFQDTTQIQYDLLSTCFKGSKSKLTAVGDNKQRIMGWAGALENVFDVYTKDFKADNIILFSNYRSAPRLVEVQHSIIKELEGEKALLPISTNHSYSKKDGVCNVWKYEGEDFEASHISAVIQNLIIQEKVEPRDICILVRNKPEYYVSKIINKLNLIGIEARIETEYQDLLSEPLILLIINLLNLITSKKNSDAWEEVLNYMLSFEMSSSYDYNRSKKIEMKLEKFIKKIRVEIQFQLKLDSILKEIVIFLNIDKIKATFPQYKQDEYWRGICNKLYEKLNEYIVKMDLKKALKKLEGEKSIPIMTIHKSKGLEFHTVFFIGLEDYSLWGYKRNPLEETNSFFVAFSRAKKSICFTFCKKRRGRVQSSSNIKRLYELLKSSGVTLKSIK